MSEPREGQWTAKPLKASWGWSDLNPYGHWVFYGLMALAILAAPNRSVRVEIFSVLLISSATLLLLRELWMRRPRRTVQEMLDHPADRDEFLAKIAVFEDGRSFGADCGILWFKQGAIGFSGERFSFLLSAGDILEARPRTGHGLRLPPSDAIGLNLPGRFVWITARAFGRSNASLHRRFRDFLIDKESINGNRQWPPLKPFDAMNVLGDSA